MAGMPYPPNLCASVPICGRLSLPEGSVCSACSVGTLSLFALLVPQRQLHQRGIFSHGIHGFPQMVRLRYWRRGYGRMPYPPNLCLSVGGTSLPEGSVCSVCSVGTLSLFALLVHLWAAHLRWFPSAVQSDCVRRPIRFRPPPD